MGASCSAECMLAKEKVETTQKRLDELHSSMQDHASKVREMIATLDDKYQEMATSKSPNIDALKQYIARQKHAKRKLDDNFRWLQQNIQETQKQNSDVMKEADGIFGQFIKRMNENFRDMLANVAARIKNAMEVNNERNERRFDDMMARMEREHKRIDGILLRMDERLKILEERCGLSSSGDFRCTGAQLYKMVEKKKQEIANRFLVERTHFRETAPTFTAASAALEAAAQFSPIPGIVSSL